MGTWVLDVQKKVVATDELHRQLWDIDTDQVDVPAEVILARIHPEDLGRVGITPEQMAQLPGSFDVEFRICRRDGEVRWVRGSAIPFRDAQGAVTKLIGVNFDITGQKQAEEALRDSEYRFRIMGETVDYGVWMCNKDGGTEYVSQSFLDLLNMSMDEIKQFGWTKRLVPEDVPGMMEKWLDCVRSGKLWDSEHRIIDRHGKIHTVLTRGKPVRDAEGNITSWVGINLDITERKKTEHALAEAKEQLRQYS